MDGGGGGGGVESTLAIRVFNLFRHPCNAKRLNDVRKSDNQASE